MLHPPATVITSFSFGLQRSMGSLQKASLRSASVVDPISPIAPRFRQYKQTYLKMAVSRQNPMMIFNDALRGKSLSLAELRNQVDYDLFDGSDRATIALASHS